MNTKQDYTPKQQEELVRIIAKGGFVSFEMEQYQVWQDLMGLEERELTLMMAGFTGLTNEEQETFGSIYIPVGKEEILSLYLSKPSPMNFRDMGWMTVRCLPLDTRMGMSSTIYISTVTSFPNDR